MVFVVLADDLVVAVLSIIQDRPASQIRKDLAAEGRASTDPFFPAEAKRTGRLTLKGFAQEFAAGFLQIVERETAFIGEGFEKDKAAVQAAIGRLGFEARKIGGGFAQPFRDLGRRVQRPFQ